MKIKLTKTNDEWSKLENPSSTIGNAPFTPQVGKLFFVYSVSGNVKTSPVVEILSQNSFRTQNSIYKWEII